MKKCNRKITEEKNNPFKYVCKNSIEKKKHKSIKEKWCANKNNEMDNLFQVIILFVIIIEKKRIQK